MARREILLIDDDLSMRAFAARVLESIGLGVREAGNGLDGLRLIEERAPDLVLVDFVMPKMNGYHFLKSVEAKNLVPDVPIILMSTLTEKVGRRLLETTRAVECLKKPYDEPDLLDVVGRHLASNAAAITATTRLHPGLEVEDDWLLVASVRERLHGTVADALAAHAQELTDAGRREEVLAVIARILDDVFDEADTHRIVELVREHDGQKKRR